MNEKKIEFFQTNCHVKKAIFSLRYFSEEGTHFIHISFYIFQPIINLRMFFSLLNDIIIICKAMLM